jgi:hypothetical protein
MERMNSTSVGNLIVEIKSLSRESSTPSSADNIMGRTGVAAF